MLWRTRASDSHTHCGSNNSEAIKVSNASAGAYHRGTNRDYYNHTHSNVLAITLANRLADSCNTLANWPRLRRTRSNSVAE